MAIDNKKYRWCRISSTAAESKRNDVLATSTRLGMNESTWYGTCLAFEFVPHCSSCSLKSSLARSLSLDSEYWQRRRSLPTFLLHFIYSRQADRQIRYLSTPEGGQEHSAEIEEEGGGYIIPNRDPGIDI